MATNEQKPLVSILMPFYNAADTLRVALRSILNQTYEHWELLLCDDGSTDGSLATAESIGDLRVQVWSDGQRKGLAARLNECIDRARGEFIARMDADDVSYPDRLRSQVEFLLARPGIDLVGCQMLVFGEDGRPLGQRRLPLEHDQIVAHPSLGFGLAHPTWMGRAEWFRRYRYDVNALRYEDVELLYRAYPSSRFSNLPDLLYGYREVRGGFHKRLKTRIGRIRYLHSRQDSTSRGTVYRATLAEAVRIVSDALFTAVSGRYVMLRLRERRLSSTETSSWRRVLDAVNDPVRLMLTTTVPETMKSFFARQIDLLTRTGFHIDAVSSPGAGLDILKHIPGVTTHAVPMRRRPNPPHDAISFLRLFGLMRRLKPDIVHAHTPKAGLLGMAAAKAAGVPARLYTIHGLPLLTSRGNWRRVLEAAERASCTLATHVYTVSPSLQKVVEEMRLCPADKVSTLGHGSCAGIDLDRFDAAADWNSRAAAIRSAYGIPDDAFLLTFLGRIARDKGIAILAEAWAKLAMTSPRLHLLLAGNADSSDPVPESILKELRNQERVHFTGKWVADVPAVYAASNIIVLPTLREGLSQVALEAGAMGVPIVSTRIPGVVNSVQDGVTGLLVTAGEAAPFAAAIKRLIDDPELRAAFGHAARQHICAHFSERLVNQLWISEYRKLASESLPGFVDRLAQIENSR